MTHSVQPKSPAIAIVRQNGLSSASCRASVAVTPVCVTADLVNPVGRWPTTGMSPLLRWPLAISHILGKTRFKMICICVSVVVFHGCHLAQVQQKV